MLKKWEIKFYTNVKDRKSQIQEGGQSLITINPKKPK